MPFKSLRTGSDPERGEKYVRFLEAPRTSSESDIAARPRLVKPPRSFLGRIISPDAIPWLLTCIFATTTILLLLERPPDRGYGAYETRFTTDLKSLNQVPLELKPFYGSPTFDENGTLSMPPVDTYAKWPENRKFVGDPTAEIDDNWNHLIEDRYFSISEAEAIEAWGDRRFEYIDQEHGGYTAGLDVFHTLHCLNVVRMALYPERYTHESMPDETNAAHTQHCLDAIRQHIQCYGSTTLVPTKWQETAGRQYIDSNQEHVCRDFSYLRKFVRRRSHGGDLYIERDKSLISKGAVETDLKMVEVAPDAAEGQ